MTLIPVEKDKQTISGRFRKAHAEMGVEVYLAQTWNHIQPAELLLLDTENGKEHCSLGHHDKEAK
ncbi:MAG: hypothetical protein U9O64_04780 [Campylobacterota bacterium]|nr:hypothetical protein [Campylobacterota bacterium]